MPETITYGDLYDKLRELGFTDERLPWNGSVKRNFRHPSVKAASVILPDAPGDAPAASLHVLSVRSMLLTHGFISEGDVLRPSREKNSA
jgi:hypothetical protein